MNNQRHNILLAEKPVLHESVKINQQLKQFEKTEDLIYYLTHKTNNKIHNNGRIYLKINAKGDLFAQSISPYSDTFLENIEPKIKNLVSGFIKKRYLTYSSCEGHGYSFRRYIGLAFSDTESREVLISEIKKLRLCGVEFVEKNSVSNNPLQFNKEQIYTYNKKIIPEDKYSEKETQAFNIQFHRHYERYYFLELIISKSIEKFNDNYISLSFIKWLWRNLPTILIKKFLLETNTKKIENLINSDTIKKYKL